MPVKIIGDGGIPLSKVHLVRATPPDADGSRITRKELNNGLYTFYNSYFTNPGRDSGFTKNVIVKLTDFQSLINSITNPLSLVYVTSPELLMLKFIHRYDQTELKWFLTMAFCEKQTQIADPDGLGRTIFPLIEKGPRYDIIDGKISLSTFADNYDTEYFDGVCYYDGAEYLLLNTSEHVKHVIFPWQDEILTMINDNYPSGAIPANVYMVFASCSFSCEILPGGPFQTIAFPFAAIRYPHGLVIYLNEDGADRLNNDDTITTFRNRGADYSTMCPPDSHCPVYIYPADLAFAESNFKMELRLHN